MSFAHLHVHSEMSLLDGAIRIPDLCERAVQHGQTAVAITDHGWIAGAVKFVKAAKDAGIKPIIGMETYLASGGDMTKAAKSGGDNYHLTLLAKNEEGYKNLMRLTSLAHLEGLSYKARIDRNTLAKYKEGIVVLSGCIGAEIPQTIIHEDYAAGLRLARWYANTFGENFFIEVMSHGAINGVDHVRVEDGGRVLLSESDLNRALVSIADSLGVGIVATNDAHYLDRGHGTHHDTLLCIGMGAWKDKPDRMRFPGAAHKNWEFYVKSEAEMLSVCPESWWQTACSNTKLVEDMIEPNVITLGQNLMPKYMIPNDTDYHRWLASRP